MNKTRIIPRLDIKGPNLVKGIHLEGLRIIGDPCSYATKYYHQGADEILYVDIVASLYGRNNLTDIVKKTAREIAIPLTVAGGIRTIDDIRSILRAGADKVSINTAAVENPDFIKKAANLFGSQCIVVAIDYKRWPDDSFLTNKNETVTRAKVGLGGFDKSHFQVYTDNGRQQTGLEAYSWAMQAADYGAGEILLTSIDHEGTQKGFDLDLSSKILKALSIPVIVGGGAGSSQHVIEALRKTQAPALSLASLLHYNKETLKSIKNNISLSGLLVANNHAGINGE